MQKIKITKDYNPNHSFIETTNEANLEDVLIHEVAEDGEYELEDVMFSKTGNKATARSAIDDLWIATAEVIEKDYMNVDIPNLEIQIVRDLKTPLPQ